MTRAEQWKAAGLAAAKQGAVELELPSGVKILARRPDVLQLAAWNRLPFSLVAAGGAEPGTGMSNEDVAALMTFMRDVLLYCCVEPRVAVEPGPGEIHPREIPMADAMFIFRWATRREEAERLRPFRRGAADARGGGDGVAAGAAAVDADGDR